MISTYRTGGVLSPRCSQSTFLHLWPHGLSSVLTAIYRQYAPWHVALVVNLQFLLYLIYVIYLEEKLAGISHQSCIDLCHESPARYIHLTSGCMSYACGFSGCFENKAATPPAVSRCKQIWRPSFISSFPKIMLPGPMYWILELSSGQQVSCNGPSYLLSQLLLTLFWPWGSYSI